MNVEVKTVSHVGASAAGSPAVTTWSPGWVSSYGKTAQSARLQRKCSEPGVPSERPPRCQRK